MIQWHHSGAYRVGNMLLEVLSYFNNYNEIYIFISEAEMLYWDARTWSICSLILRGRNVLLRIYQRLRFRKRQRKSRGVW